MLPIKKIYIDTRQKTADSASDSDFSIDLPITYLMPDDTGFYVEDVCLPVSWYTIETGKNGILFFECENVLRQAIIKEGNYTTAEFAAAINTALYIATGALALSALNPLPQHTINQQMRSSFNGTLFTSPPRARAILPAKFSLFQRTTS